VPWRRRIVGAVDLKESFSMDAPVRHARRITGPLRRSCTRVLRRVAPRRLAVTRELALRVTVASAAAGVTAPVRFAGNELLLRRRLQSYRIRRSGMRIFVRHPMADAWVVHEVINRGVYRPPPPVERLLRARDHPLRIVDLGAHVGSTTLLMLELFPRAHVTAFEPNPATAAVLRRAIAANGLQAQCEVRQAAAGVAPGTALMEGFSLLAHLVRDDAVEAVDQFPFLRAYQAGGSEPEPVEVVDVLPDLQGADLIKMDIEGGEWRILQDPRFAQLQAGALVLEYHPQGAPQPDTTEAVRALLARAGFRVGEPFDQHHGVGLIWAWRDEPSG
jgi:FkbM family methyltransferase